MTITTREFNLSKADLRRILFQAKIRPRAKVFYAMLLLVGCVVIMGAITGAPSSTTVVLPVTIAVLYPLAIWGWLWSNARSALNAGAGAKRSYNITITPAQATLTARFEEGNYEEFDITRPDRILVGREYKIIYLTKLAMLYIPDHVFLSHEDCRVVGDYLITHARKIKR